ncbi:SDR family oxidoreductase [Paucilactobacillus hokkaidonensis]|uniref:SDR family oxidoreductase n=1 Tax=Paucilactobacillus hokkaidonensis TaxID=1193095 RepID=UPI000A77C9D5
MLPAISKRLILRQLADKSRNDEILGRIPAGHWAETYELMGSVVFLASNASNYVNGHVLAVDGGYLVR